MNEKMYTFVLKDKGTGNEGWWLKISSADELANYYEKDNRGSRVMDEYMNGKHKSMLTQAIEMYSANNKLTIWQGYSNFTMMVASQQLDCIREYGAIYVNEVGGYHMMSKDDVEYAVVKRNSKTFPKDGEVIEGIEIKIMDKKKEEEYGFISTSGKFYVGEWSTHAELARKIIKENDWVVDDIYGQNVAINYLIKDKGFVLVHNPAQIEDCFVVDNGNITEEQRVFLYQYFLDSGNPWRASDYE